MGSIKSQFYNEKENQFTTTIIVIDNILSKRMANFVINNNLTGRHTIKSIDSLSTNKSIDKKILQETSDMINQLFSKYDLTEDNTFIEYEELKSDVDEEKSVKLQLTVDLVETKDKLTKRVQSEKSIMKILHKSTIENNQFAN